jgi:hypothetical protein
MGRAAFVVSLLVCALVLLSGCRRAIPFTASAIETEDGFLEITATTKENGYYRIGVTGHPEDHFDYTNTPKLKIPLESIPKGPTTLDVQLTQGKRKGSFPLKVERQPLKPVLTITPDGSGTAIACSGTYCKGTIPIVSGHAKVTLTTMKGTKVRIGATEIVTDARQSKQELALFRPEDVVMAAVTKGTTLVQVPVHIESPEGVAQDGTLDLAHGTFVGEVRAALGKVASGPVTFGDEPPTPKPARSLFWIFETELMGSAQHLRDVDLVAVTSFPTVRKVSCGTYKGRTTGAEVTIDRELQDYDMTVYDRRSGKTIAKRRFAAPLMDCPDSTFSRDDLHSHPSADPIRKWLATMVPKT